jgi:hypothetical protein
MLERQLSYLKQLNLPVLIISGCTVPEHISNQVDYVIINTENDLLGKDWTYLIESNNFSEYVYDCIESDHFYVRFYWPNVNSTITKNIKLAFNLAKSLGYKNVFYTEDDNVWKEGSFDYIRKNLDVLKKGRYKLAGVIGTQFPIEYSIFFTTFFFANINFLIENLTLPNTKNEWYDLENITRYNLNKTYEGCWYDLFSSQLELIYNNINQFTEINKDKNNLEINTNDRHHSEKNLLNTFLNVVPSNENSKVLFIFNPSEFLLEGVKSYSINIYYDDQYYHSKIFNPYEWYYDIVPNHVKKVKIVVNGNSEIIVDCSEHNIKNNGKIIFHK